MQKGLDKNLYTVIMYYQGGTYISQVMAKGIKDALIVWTRELDISIIEELNDNNKKLLQELAVKEMPSLIDGMTNIWYTDFLLSDNYMHAHIIKTNEF
ncbi:MAG: hypothetical protein MUW56_17505 [Chryseobacterium sp.]|uniref:hypothetical protein n=1 Tax=Chryseobacterium sp. TaxID=1871047 RepID=UPI0025C20E19|nr:hypothetical protein [Chryseobacterium sp.]MCJ7935367.1 hypothetical protein [Chryseobacterium sp.]